MLPAPMKKFAIPVILLTAIGGGIYATAKPGPKKDQVTYETDKVKRESVKSFVAATGVIQPWKTVDIKANVAGRIDKLMVDLGDSVKSGQLIALIDPTDTRTAKEQAEADYDSAMARQEQARVNLKQQQQQTLARIAASRQAVRSAEARLAQAQANSTAQPKLTKFNIAQAQAALVTAGKTKQQAEKAKKQLLASLSNLREVTIPLNVRTVESSVDEARANMDSVAAEYRRQRALLASGYVAESEVQTASARLASARATVQTAQQRKQTLQRENNLAEQELQARIDEADDRIAESESRIIQAQAALDLTQTNQVQDVVREREFRAAQAAVEQAKAELNSAISEKNQIDVRRQEIVSASAQIVRSQAAIKQANQNLEFTRIVAPRAGVVIAKNVEEGTVVPSGRGAIGSTNAMIQIGDVSRLWIVCNVDETDIAQVSVGQRVTVNVDAYPSLLVDGKVIRMDPQAKVEQNVTYIPVTVEIDTPDPRFKPLMNANCEFIVEEANDVLTVPNEALKESEGTYTVEKLEAGKPVSVPVEVGIAGQDSTEIRSGLKEDEEIVTKTVRPQEQQAGTNNPFNPFGGMGGNRGGARGGAGGGTGGGGGGPRGGR